MANYYNQMIMPLDNIIYDGISRMLTLRYDPLKKSDDVVLLTENDFTEKRYKNIETTFDNIIHDYLMSFRDGLNFDSLSMSLSSGIDSNLTLVLIKEILPDIKVNCVTIGFGQEDDEIERASEIARMYDCNFQSIIKQDILSDLPYLISIVKEPKWNLYNYYALEWGKKYSNIFFTGDGGDELFGGYTFRYDKFLSLVDSNTDWIEKVKAYLLCHERDWVTDQECMFGDKINFSWKNIYLLFQPYFDNDLHPLNQIFLADFNGKLTFDWIPTNMSFEKKLDLEIVSIFLNRKLIEFASHIPWQMKYDPITKQGKIILNNILKRFRGFSEFEIVKKGFVINTNTLWEKNNEIINQYLNKESEIVKDNIIRKDWLVSKLEYLRNSESKDIRYINKMLTLFALEIWYRLFISKSLYPNTKL